MNYSPLLIPEYSTIENGRYIWTVLDQVGNKYRSRLTSKTLSGAKKSFERFKSKRDSGDYNQNERNFGKV